MRIVDRARGSALRTSTETRYGSLTGDGTSTPSCAPGRASRGCPPRGGQARPEWASAEAEATFPTRTGTSSHAALALSNNPTGRGCGAIGRQRSLTNPAAPPGHSSQAAPPGTPDQRPLGRRCHVKDELCLRWQNLRKDGQIVTFPASRHDAEAGRSPRWSAVDLRPHAGRALVRELRASGAGKGHADGAGQGRW